MSDSPPPTILAKEGAPDGRAPAKVAGGTFNLTSVTVSLPLPPPDILEQYDRLGLLTEVLEMTKSRLHHQQESDRYKNETARKEIEARAAQEVRDNDNVSEALKEQRAQRHTSVAVLFGLAVIGAILLTLGKDLGGYAALLTATSLIVGSFLRNSGQHSSK